MCIPKMEATTMQNKAVKKMELKREEPGKEPV